MEGLKFWGFVVGTFVSFFVFWYLAFGLNWLLRLLLKVLSKDKESGLENQVGNKTFIIFFLTSYSIFLMWYLR